MNTGKSTQASLPSFKRGNLVEMVFEVLRERVLDGTYEAGELMPTQEVLAKQLGVSRTVLREAFNKLSSLGLIRSYQGRGTIVQTPDMSTVMRPMLDTLQLDAGTIRELMEARYHIESAVTLLAAKHADEESIVKLGETISAMEEGVRKNNTEAIVQADYDFHIQLAEMSKNRVLKQIIGVLREILVRFLQDFNKLPGTPERALTYHQRIFDAVHAKSAEQAVAAMKEHIMDVSDTVKTEFKIEVNI